MASLTEQINQYINQGATVAGAAQSTVTAAASLFGVGGPTGTSTMYGPDPNNLSALLNRKRGVMPTNMFYVGISPPACVVGGQSAVQDLALLADSAMLPGVSLATTEIVRYGYGIQEKKPYAAMFTDLTVSFIATSDTAVHNFFYSWMNGIIKFDKDVHASSNARPFSVNYKDNYKSVLQITVFNQARQKLMVYKIKDAYPTAIGDVQLSWSDNNNFVRIPVTFTFFNYEIEEFAAGDILNAARGGNFLSSLMKVGTAVQTLAMIQKPRNIADYVNVVNNSTMAFNALSSATKGFLP